MNRLRIIRPALTVVLFLTGPVWALAPNAEEMATARRWIANHLSGDANTVPFSFTFGGESSRELVKNWPLQRSSRKLDDQRTGHTLVYTDPRSKMELRCEAIEYHDFPTLEWTLYFRNGGPADSPIAENIQALDAHWKRGADGEFLLHHATGAPSNGSDYGPLETPLGPGVTKRISAAGGRPTNSDWSYLNLEFGGQGAIIVVGWPGQWAADFVRDSADGIQIRAGQEITHFTLKPGEEVRTPLIVVQSWTGDWIRAQNLWRRWMMAHSMPKPGGKLPPPQFVASSSRAYEEMIGANEANQIMHIDRYLEEGLKLDYWWMDAGWYVQQQGWPQVGTWEVDPKRFPKGLRPISDHAHSKDVKILVWFEPERVMPGTWLYENHPEWLLKPTSSQGDRLAGLRAWSAEELGTGEPCVNCNLTSDVQQFANIRWEPGQLSCHPGPKGEYSVVRFTAPEGGEYAAQVTFLAVDATTTTDVHMRQGDKSIFDGWINLQGQGKSAAFTGKVTLTKGETLDFIVGWGNESFVCDSTGLDIRLTSPSGKTFDAAREFRPEQNRPDRWNYGYLKPGPTPETKSFRPYDRPKAASEEGVRLLNLGNTEAREWLTNHVDRLLTDQGIDLYRQDFNMDPLAFWRAADAPDRQGITEIQHVTGYLAYWDELRRRHPHLLIDSCASGGRRNDLETMRRAVPLWRSDYAYEATGHQCMTYGISLWLPYHGTGTVASASAPYYGGGPTKIESYAWWSNAAPSLGSGIDIRVKDLDYEALRRLYQQFRRISPNYFGDFYPLTPWTRDNKAWIAWQFDRPETGEGIVKAFRRPEAEADSARFLLGGLDREAKYELTNIEGGEARIMNGEELITQGLPLTISERPGVVIYAYQRVKP